LPKRVTFSDHLRRFPDGEYYNTASGFLAPRRENMSGDVSWHCLTVVWPTVNLLGDSVILWIGPRALGVFGHLTELSKRTMTWITVLDLSHLDHPFLPQVPKYV
jgi:hypothetical protein